ncbi:MAG: dephospho-CoA kinase [Kiritimatiellae bacterium]|nr:dephospho-CoA kinase [Kiritimatiellia bacterium]
MSAFRAIALTGGIACGKSTALAMFREAGCETIDADDVAHEWMGPGGEGAAAIAREFGAGVMAPNGGVDRKALGRIVFADPAARERLNALSHPAIRSLLLRWRGAVRDIGVAAIPLLFESGWEGDWDGVVCITAPEDAVMRRLAGRGLSPEEARARIAAQWPLDEKARRATWVLPNGSTPGALRNLVRELVDGWKRTPPN